MNVKNLFADTVNKTKTYTSQWLQSRPRYRPCKIINPCTWYRIKSTETDLHSST